MVFFYQCWVILNFDEKHVKIASISTFKSIRFLYFLLGLRVRLLSFARQITLNLFIFIFIFYSFFQEKIKTSYLTREKIDTWDLCLLSLCCQIEKPILPNLSSPHYQVCIPQLSSAHLQSNIAKLPSPLYPANALQAAHKLEKLRAVQCYKA